MIGYPKHEEEALRRLWREAFGDEEGFLDLFFAHGYDRTRCRCLWEDGDLAGALYWFDCECDGEKYAYLYGVATAMAHRGKGICRALMADTHALLAREGYAAVTLVPQQEGLRRMYAAMGYRNCGGLEEIICTPGEPTQLRAVGPAEFARLRRQYLGEGSVLQEGRGLSFLANQAQFYAGRDFLLTAWEEDGCLHGLELLGNTDAAPGITAALGCRKGYFRVPGETPFAMFLPLKAGAKMPDYFGFAFD